MNNQDLLKQIDLKMLDAKRHFLTFHSHMEQAEKLIKLGIEQKNSNNIYFKNALGILAGFMSNGSVREIAKMIQAKMKDGE